MNQYFEKAFEFTLGAEGGYTDNPNDPGGETKFGICKRDFPNEDIKNLTIERAKEIAYKNYWIPSDCDKLVSVGYPMTAIVSFDAGFNCGPITAKKFIQKYLGVEDDGIIGPQTLRTLSLQSDLKVAIGVVFEREDYYDLIETKNAKFLGFEKGWERRVIDLLVIEIETFYVKR